MIEFSSNFQILFSVPITLVSVKDQWFWEMKLFLFKNHIFDPKLQNNNNQMFDTVFNIIV